MSTCRILTPPTDAHSKPAPNLWRNRRKCRMAIAGEWSKINGETPGRSPLIDQRRNPDAVGGEAATGPEAATASVLLWLSLLMLALGVIQIERERCKGRLDLCGIRRRPSHRVAPKDSIQSVGRSSIRFTKIHMRRVQSCTPLFAFKRRGRRVHFE